MIWGIYARQRLAILVLFQNRLRQIFPTKKLINEKEFRLINSQRSVVTKSDAKQLITSASARGQNHKNSNKSHA